MKTVKRLLIYLQEHKFYLGLAIILTISSSLLEIIAPKLMGNITTKIFENISSNMPVDFKYILNICIILGIAYILQGVLEFINGRILVKISQKVIARFRREISEKVKHIPMAYYDKNKTGDLLSRMTNDVETLGKNLQETINRVLTSIVLIVGMLGMMLSISYVLTLVFLITLPVSYFATKTIAKKSQGFFRRKSKGLGTVVSFVEENFSGSNLIKAYNYEDFAEEEFIEINNNLYEVSYKASFLTGIMQPIMVFVSNFGYVLLCITGGFEVLRGRINIGDIQAIIQYVRKINMPIDQLAEMANMFQASIAAGDRIFEFLDQEEEIDSFKNSLSAPVKNIDFKDVEFSYDVDPVINGLNLKVERGESIAIVGPTGAGKTTLVNLLMRFYDVNSGGIFINGVDIRSVPRSNLRSLFGMVLQDTWLFKGSIYENIKYGREDATYDEVIEASKQSYCHNFINTLPDGYDTILNEDATNISQGQRQLLTIARALLSDPEILILDEATSSVDTRTESLIQKAMANLLEGRTNFIIAHRLSTIVEADRILVMDKGDIVEMGTHRELLEQNGIYAGLFNAQFSN